MNRRGLLRSSSLVGVATALGIDPTELLRVEASPTATETFGYDRVLGIEEMLEIENAASRRALAVQPLAVVPIFFDEKKGEFVRARQVEAELDQGSYTLHAFLRGVHIREARLDEVKTENLQLHMHVGVPQSDNPEDILSWLVMNGIEIFGSPAEAGAKLIKFEKGASLTGVFDPGKGIDVTNGRLNLALELFGHKKESWWEKLLKIGRAIVGTPVFGQLGLPVLVKQALEFTTAVLTKVREKERLVTLLGTRPMPFTVCKGLNTPLDRYKLRQGLWVAMDIQEAERTNYLQDFEVNLDSTLYEVRHRQQKADYLSAEYLVMDFQLTPKKN